MASIATVDELKAMTPDERDTAISWMTIAEWDEISSDGQACFWPWRPMLTKQMLDSEWLAR